MHNNAPSHAAKKTEEYLMKLGFRHEHDRVASIFTQAESHRVPMQPHHKATHLWFWIFSSKDELCNVILA